MVCSMWSNCYFYDGTKTCLSARSNCASAQSGPPPPVPCALGAPVTEMRNGEYRILLIVGRVEELRNAFARDENPPPAQCGLLRFFGLDFFNLSDAILSAKARDAIASAYGPEQLILL